MNIYLRCMLRSFILVMLLSTFSSSALAAGYRTYDGSIATYQDFRNGTNNSTGYDADGAWDRQCWDGVQVLYKRLGMSLSTGNIYNAAGEREGYAKHCWDDENARAVNTGSQFLQITRIEDVKRGDVVVFNGPYYTGHIGFADEDNNPNCDTITIWGQNQVGNGSGYPFTAAEYKKSFFLGAFRYKGWISEIRGSEMSSGNDRVLPDGDYLIANAADPTYFLDISGGAMPAGEGDNVQLWHTSSGTIGDCDAWTIKYENGYYRISQYGYSRSLDVSGADTLQGKNVQVWGNNDSSAQKWAISQIGWNGYRIQAKCSGYSLDIENGSISEGTNVRQWTGNDSNAQTWVFIPYKPSQPIAEGRYILVARGNTAYELDVAGDTGDVENGRNVQIWNDESSDFRSLALSQYNSFDVKKVTTGYYKLIHTASGKCLDVQNSGAKNNTNICLATDNGNSAQRWAITPQNGGYMLRAMCSGYALDLLDGKHTNGQNVAQHFWNGSNAQTWYFVPAEHTVTFNANGGSGAPAKQTKYYKGNLTLSSAKPTRAGYTFQGWATSATATTVSYRPGASYTQDADLTLYAVWKISNYTITYNANGGVNPPATQTKLPGEALAFSTEIPTRTGYTFLGWARSANATTPEYQPGDTYSTDADLTLYAMWRITNPPVLTGSNFNLLVGDSRSWRDFVTLSHDGVLSYTLQASVSGNAIVLSGDQVTAKAVGPGTITVKVVEYPAASCTLSVEVVDLSTMLKLPVALTTIEAEAFENSGIIAVNIPTKCVSIGSKAFANNRGLVYAFIPKSVSDIAPDAFAGCPNLIIYCYSDTDAYYYAKSNGIKYQLLSNEWVSANEVPLGATVTDEKWTYKKTVTETKTSTETSMSGWTRGDYTWEKTKDGSYDFAVFPDGFDTGHALYSKYAVPSVPAETDRRLGTKSQKSYIYWHWCFIDACAASDTDHNVLVEDARRTNVNISGSVYRDFIYFDAFESSTNYGTIGPGKNGNIDVAPMRYAWRGVLDDASQWWWRFDIQTQNYTDYHKLYSYSRTLTTEESSSSAVVEGNGISNVQHWVKYSY